MKLTFRDIVWIAIIALVVVILSKCHRDKSYDLTSEAATHSKAKDSVHRIEQQQADNKLAILLGQLQNAAEAQRTTDARLSQSLTAIARLSAGVKRAKEFPLDSNFTMVAPEYINYCDSLVITSERIYEEYDDFKQKNSYLLLAKDTAIRLQAVMLKQERAAYTACRTDYDALLRACKRAPLPRNQVFLGAELIGNQHTLLQNVGAVVSLKTKTNKLWQISGGLQSGGGYYARINGNILISLKK